MSNSDVLDLRKLLDPLIPAAIDKQVIEEIVEYVNSDDVKQCFDIQRVACEQYHFVPATNGEANKKAPLEPHDVAIKGLAMWLWKFLMIATR